MRLGVFSEKVAALTQGLRQRTVNRNSAERREPRALGHQRQRRAPPEMVGGQDNVGRTRGQPAVNGPGHVSRIHVACVRHEAPDRSGKLLPGRSGSRTGVLFQVFQKGFRIGRIEPARHRRMANLLGVHGKIVVDAGCAVNRGRRLSVFRCSGAVAANYACPGRVRRQPVWGFSSSTVIFRSRRNSVSWLVRLNCAP